MARRPPVFLAWLIGFFGLCSTVLAQEPVTAAERLQAQLDGLTSYDASFVQTTYDSDDFVLDEQSGSLRFARPGKLRWESEAPFKQILVSNGDHIYLYDPDLRQVTLRQWSNDPAENPAAVFVSGTPIETYFAISAVGEASRFILTPQDVSSTMSSIEIYFEAGLLRGMTLRDRLGQTTTVQFSDVQVNTAIDDAVFLFDIPDGVEVIADG